MFFKKEYTINEWTKWDSTVFDAIKNFYDTFTLKPNIIQANEHTFSQFDFLSDVRIEKRQNVVNKETNEKIPQGKEVNLDCYSCKLADIDFAIDNKLQDKSFCLIYDDDVEWISSEMPDVPEEEIEEDEFKSERIKFADFECLK